MILYEGKLFKASSSYHGKWTPRWFELRRHVLLYYKTKGDPQACGVVPLHGATITAYVEDNNNREELRGIDEEVCIPLPVGVSDDRMKVASFRVYHPNRRTYFLAAKNDKEMLQWVDQINKAMLDEDDTSNLSGTTANKSSSSSTSSHKHIKSTINDALTPFSKKDHTKTKKSSQAALGHSIPSANNNNNNNSNTHSKNNSNNNKQQQTTNNNNNNNNKNNNYNNKNNNCNCNYNKNNYQLLPNKQYSKQYKQ